MSEPRRKLCSGIPYHVEVVYHSEFGEYEAYIPGLGRYLFTAAGNTEVDAIRELGAIYPDMLRWLMKNSEGPIPGPDLVQALEIDCKKAQPKPVGLSSILELIAS